MLGSILWVLTVATAITASGIVFITLVITEKKKDVATIKSKVSLRPCFV